jgi:hypothetical protein
MQKGTDVNLSDVKNTDGSIKYSIGRSTRQAYDQMYKYYSVTCRSRAWAIGRQKFSNLSIGYIPGLNNAFSCRISLYNAGNMKHNFSSVWDIINLPNT